MFVHVVTEVWRGSNPEGHTDGQVIAVFASMGDAESFVWDAEESHGDSFAYFVSAMPVVPENGKVEINA